MALTLINWAGRVWPFFKGCQRISEGCDHCYAITQANMRAANPNPKIADQFAGLTHRDAEGRLDWTGKVNFVPEHLRDPLRLIKPDRWFVNSLADLFYEMVSRELIAAAFAVMACCPQHVFLGLTKRHGRMRAVLNDPEFIALYQATYVQLAAGLRAENPRRWGHLPETGPWPLENLHLGVSAENKKWFDIRVPALLDCRDAAGALWVSYEPALEEIDASMCAWSPPGAEGVPGVHNPLTGEWWPAPGDGEYEGGRAGLPRLDWIVAGGESGSRARRCEGEWILSLSRQCADAGVPFWMKQTGTVLARELGLPGKGDEWDLLPPEYRVRELPSAAGVRT